MTLAAGNVEYSLGNHPVTGLGVSWTQDELDSALAGPVSEAVFDNPGKVGVAALLTGLAETDFEKQGVERILSDTKPPENWRVGEALAEAYLVHQKDCYFPWPDGRDERKAGSSLPGADLVGFQEEAGEDYFAFGEVKTSAEEKYPPGAMYGHHGLKEQLEDLKENNGIRDNLVKYLTHRATAATWKSRFQKAAKNYLQSSTAVRVFGVLVRDVEPNQDDLRARLNKLAIAAPSDMQISLLALYLPSESISTLSKKVVAVGGGAK